MDKNKYFNSYLFVSSNKLVISINQVSDFKEIYKDELTFDIQKNKIEFEMINLFIEKNIFKIEKLLKNFVKNIELIIDNDQFLKVELSVKKENYGEKITPNTLIFPLKDAKDQCQKTFHGNKVVHMFIEKYYIDNKVYSNLPSNLKCNNFSLDIVFICLDENLIDNFRKILKKYQIKINHIIDAKYAKSLIRDNKDNIFSVSQKVIGGCNENEIIIVDKKPKNSGFFENFFNFFR